jgi:GTP-binding protein
LPYLNQMSTEKLDNSASPLFTPDEIAAGERLFAGPARFVRGAPSLETLPPADRPEVAFAGRSNVGKSSLINALVNQHGLARTSNTPGRTQELNFYVPPGANIWLVDMPGYGFAEAPKDKVAAWTHLLRAYLRGRARLKRAFVLIDARHGIKAVDREIMALLNEAAVSFQVVLTKADKINVHALTERIAETVAALAKEPAAHPVVLATSAEKKTGIDELRAAIALALA